MNEQKCCAAAPAELLNEIAQEIIDKLAAVNDLACVIEDRMYGSEPQKVCNAKEAPTNLKDRLICIRNQVNEIGGTLETVQKKV
jgi:hypothetical protein